MFNSLEELAEIMKSHGAKRLYAKQLAPNDNSKNQVYLGGGFGALNIIPHGNIFIDASRRGGAQTNRPKATVDFYWVGRNGLHRAPGANLILYPDYPEVRISGFLRDCSAAPRSLMTERLEGRVMIFGVTEDRKVLGAVFATDHPVSAEIKGRSWPTIGVFLDLNDAGGQSTRHALLAELRRVHAKGWITGQKLTANGIVPYSAPNAGGYTLEAELGISPNGYADPDYLGWEVKQYGVSNFERFTPKSPVTLMTPEPTGGIYREEGAKEFVSRFGYVDTRGRAGRMNFGGAYRHGGQPHARTGCSITVEGFDTASGKIDDLDAKILLHHTSGQIAASWSIKDMMEHWNRKHAKAAYMPSISERSPRRYRYGHPVMLCEETDFILFLKAFVDGKVYYDPGIKVVVGDGHTELKRRSQFRIRHADLPRMYHSHQVIDIREAAN